MSAVESILFRAMSEPEFARQLFENPEAVLIGYQLSEGEFDQFKRISRDRSSASASQERKSFSGSAPNTVARCRIPY